MTTRGAMKTEILDDMRRTETADGTRVLAAISTAIKFYQSRRFYFNESRSVTFPTVASTDTYSFVTIGTEFYRIDGAFITIAAGDVRELCPQNYANLEEMADEDTTTGEPSDYAYIAKALRLWRNPDAIYTIRLTGHVKVAEPAADDTADNAWFVEAYELIRSRAKVYLYGHKEYYSSDMLLVATEAEKAARRELLSITHDRVSVGRLVPTEF